MNLKKKYYLLNMQHLLDNNSDSSNRSSLLSNENQYIKDQQVVKKLVNIHEKLIHDSENKEVNHVTCGICKDLPIFDESLDIKTSKKKYIILSCNHIYHIKCLAEEHFNDVLKYPLIDNDYFDSRKCNICLKNLLI